tara:strand:+ start:348 stop:1058 length:711 start_codon:yes stop_codon:yes gene_type:complete
MENIVIFGDSHTRSYANYKNIFPFFLGPGTEFNLFKHNIQKIESKIESFFCKYHYNYSKTLFCLNFGEPNCRYLLNNDWQIFSKIKLKQWKEIPIDNKNAEINYLIQNYEHIINMLRKYTNNIAIITPTTAFFPSYNYMTYFNTILKNKYDDMIIDIYNEIAQPSLFDIKKYDKIECKKSLLNNDIDYDPIHLNNNIVDIFIDILNRKQILSQKFYTVVNESLKFKVNSTFNSNII